jgi:hypothetical protein
MLYTTCLLRTLFAEIHLHDQTILLILLILLLLLLRFVRFRSTLGVRIHPHRPLTFCPIMLPRSPLIFFSLQSSRQLTISAIVHHSDRLRSIAQRMSGIQSCKVAPCSTGWSELAAEESGTASVDIDDALPCDLGFVPKRRIGDELEEDWFPRSIV